jgi:hypothetical protein
MHACRQAVAARDVRVSLCAAVPMFLERIILFGAPFEPPKHQRHERG